MTNPDGITLREAAERLSLKDTRTVVKYGREGRVRISGTGVGQRVDPRSIVEYMRGETSWHKRNTPVANQEPAPSATRRPARSHGRPLSPSDTTSTATTPLLRGRKLQRI